MKRFCFAAHPGKKGSTLAELCVVLAVVSIIALAVISFTTMSSARSTVSAAKLNMIEDQRLAKIVLNRWFEEITAANATVTANEDGLWAEVASDTYEVLLEEDRIVAPLPDGTALYCPVNALTSFSFESMTNATGDAIYFCTTHYTLPNPSGNPIQRSFTFALNPHTGDVYEEVTP